MPQPRFRRKLELLLGEDIETLMSPATKSGATPKSSAAKSTTTTTEEKNRDSHSTI